MKPIAMRCTQQDWEDIKPILDKHIIKYIKVDVFNKYPYLVNNWGGDTSVLTNVEDQHKNSYNRTVYEEWDKNIFLEACDIKIDDFVLPEKWCIVTTDENIVVVKKWLQDVKDYDIYNNDWSIGNIYCIEGKHVDGWMYFAKEKKTGYTEITYEQFCKYILKQEIKETTMDNRFFFSLQPFDAQKIIDIACSTWKTKLASQWANSIVLNLNIEITESFYKKMRKACTAEQNILFDSIFGKDIIFKKDDIVVVTGTSTYNYGLSTGNIKPIVGKSYKYVKFSNGLAVLEVNALNSISISNNDIRLATEEEVKAFNSYSYTRGELVFVKNSPNNEWSLRYTNGVINDYNHLECYNSQHNYGDVTSWLIYQPAPGVKLPD